MQKSATLVQDVNVEIDAERLVAAPTVMGDGYSIITPFPLHGAKHDTEPVDKGSDSSDGADADEDGDSDPDGDLDADLDEVCDSRSIRGGGENAQLTCAGSVRPDAEGLLQAARVVLQSMHVVLMQAQAPGNLNLEAQVQMAIHIEE